MDCVVVIAESFNQGQCFGSDFFQKSFPGDVECVVSLWSYDSGFEETVWLTDDLFDSIEDQQFEKYVSYFLVFGSEIDLPEEVLENPVVGMGNCSFCQYDSGVVIPSFFSFDTLGS